MWSAVNWLSQKAGINLDDANEVLNCSDSTNNQASTDLEEQTRESGKENLAGTSNGAYNTPAGSKRSRRSSRWVSGTNGIGTANTSSSSYIGSASPPITPIMVPSGSGGGGTFRTSIANGQLSHPAMPPIMVPTGPRNNSAGFGSLTGLVSPSATTMGMHSKNSSPTSLNAWKDVSMAADVNSPGFAFRIVRQAEKQVELGSRNYPTVQEKYLHAKHLPSIKLRGSTKPVLTPLKPRSAPLLPLAPPSPPSSEESPQAPILPGSTSPSTATLFPSPHSSSPMPDFRNSNYYASPAMRSSESGSGSGSVGRPLPPVLMNVSSPNGLSGGAATTSVGLAASMAAADFASLAAASSNVSVTVGLGRASSNPSSSNGEVFSPASGSEDIDLLGDEYTQQQEDPTSLQAVLAALGKSQSGKGVKRGRMAEYEDAGNKRQCSDSLPQTLNCITQPSVGDNSSTSNGTVAVITSSSSSSGGEKRALDTSSGSSTSLNNSGHGSPCAKLPRTSPNDAFLPQSSLYEGSVSSSSSAQLHGSSDAAAVITNGSSRRPSYSLAKQRVALASGTGTTITITDSSKNTKVSSSPFGAKSTRLFSSLNQSIGLGGTSGEGSDVVLDEECPKKKKRCVNPWFASMSSSRKMLTQEQISPKMESEFDAQNDSDDSDDKSSEDSDHLSERSMVVNGCGDGEGATDDGGGEQETAINSNRNHTSPSVHAVASTSTDSSPRGATPRLVSLAAHRSDKKATNTRLKKMMGLLFNLTDEEIELSETPSQAVTTSTTSAASVSKNTSASIAQSQSVLSVPAFFNNASVSNTASTTSESIPSFTFSLKPPTVSTTSSSSDAPVAAVSGNDVTASATFKLPSTAPNSGFAGVLASAVASISSAGGSTKGTETTTVAGSGESTVPSDMSRAATLPVSSLVTGDSSVIASFTVALPNRATTVPTSNMPTLDASIAALPSYSEAKKSSDVHGVNPLQALLSSSTNMSKTAAAPSFNFGTSSETALNTNSFTNPLLTKPISQNTEGKTKSISAGFLTSSGTSSTPAATSLSATFTSTSAAVSQASRSGASNLFSFGSSPANALNPTGTTTTTEKTSPLSSNTAAAAAAPPSFFSFGSGPTSTASSGFTAPGAGLVSFGADASKAAAETSLPSAVKPSGFIFGKTSTLSTSFTEASKDVRDQAQSAKPTSGFSFGGAPAAHVTDSNPVSSAAKSLFSFGSSASSTGANPLLNTSTSATQGGDSVATAATAPASLFSFGNKPVAAPTTSATAGAAPSAGMFSFGGNPSTASSSTAATFNFGPGAAAVKTSFETSSTSASFNFAPKATNEKSVVKVPDDTTNKPAVSPFILGGGAGATANSTNSGTATNIAANQVPSSFTFGSAATSASNTPNISGAVSKPPAGSSLFSFGSSAATAPAPPAFGSTPATIASTNPSAIFGASVTNATPGNNPPPSFGSAVSPNPPAFGAAVASTTTTNTFGSFSASASNPFAGATANASVPNVNASFSFGATAAAKPSKSVTFGASTVMTGNSANLFGQATAQPPAASTATNVFGQLSSTSTPGPTSGSIFGQTPGTTQFGSSTFGQTASAAPPASQTNQSTGTAAASPFQFGATAASGGSATTGSTGFSFGSSSSTGGAPVFGATPAPSFGSSVPASNPPPAFGSAATSNLPAFGATASSTGTPAFGAAPSTATPSFGAGAAVPSFGAPTNPASGMFPFSPGNPGSPQQPNAFSAGPYNIGGQQLGGPAGQDSLNVFSVAGGNSANAASRRPRARAHRRNR